MRPTIGVDLFVGQPGNSLAGAAVDGLSPKARAAVSIGNGLPVGSPPNPTQYFGYLRRDADIAGLSFWLGQINSAPLKDVTKQHAMVCSFITSAEYQNRFGQMLTHSNLECE